jgi:LacI family transcriptional regulator
VSNVWTLIIGDIENPFFTGIARGVEDAASRAGYSVVLCNSDENVGKERSYLDNALHEQVAGVILSPASDRETDLESFLRRGLAMVTVDRHPYRGDTDSVMVNNAEGAYSATRHLIEQGYQRIALLGGRPTVTTSHERRLGYRRALEEEGREVEPRLEAWSSLKQADGQAAMRKLLAVRPRPDAVFVVNYLMAMGAVQAIREAGLRVPEDVAVATFDEVPWGELIEPRLTVVAQPVYEIGRNAGQMLLERLGNRRSPTQHRVLSTELRIRESSARATP